MRSLLLLSIPDVWELPWLVVDELQVLTGLCGTWPGARKLSVSMPDVCELPWLVVEFLDRRLWWDMLPALLPLARHRLSRWSMSSSRASLMYDSLYCFFSAEQHSKRQMCDSVQLLHTSGCWGEMKKVPSFSSKRRTCLRTGCRFM